MTWRPNRATLHQTDAMRQDGDPYENLANAIVITAAKDYRDALRSLTRNKNNNNAKRMKEEVERFFNSDWYSVLTDLDGAFLMRKIQEEVGYHDG